MDNTGPRVIDIKAENGKGFLDRNLQKEKLSEVWDWGSTGFMCENSRNPLKKAGNVHVEITYVPKSLDVRHICANLME